MSVSGLPNVRKLWGKIDSDMDAGLYRVVITNSNLYTDYDVTTFNGEKHIVLSEVGHFGGRHILMGVIYVVVGSIAILCAGLILSTYIYKRRYGIDV